MAGAKAKDGAAQGAAPIEKQELFDHIVTQADLDANPDLVGAGVKVGETIQVPVKDEESKESAPEWVGQVIKLVSELKEEIAELRKAQVKSSKEATPNAVAESAIEVDLYASYVVAEGKSFRDNKDFTKEYKSGDDVTAFDEEVLKRLLNQGLIEAVEGED